MNNFSYSNHRYKFTIYRILLCILLAMALMSVFSWFGFFKINLGLGNFTHEIGNCYITKVHPKLLRLFIYSDVMSDNFRSKLSVYEDGTPLSYPHSQHADIRTIGNGRFSHWGKYIYMSSLDNSDPGMNGKKYMARYTVNVPPLLFIVDILLMIFLCWDLLAHMKKSGSRLAIVIARCISRPANILREVTRRVIAASKSKGFDTALFFILVMLGIMIQSITFFGQPLLVCPDSGNYIANGIAIKDSWDFSGVTSMRTPGYQLFLASIFKIFGSHSAFWLRLFQHLMGLIIIITVYFIALELFENRRGAFLCGLLSCFSLQLWSYASYVMTEIFYSFFIILTIYFYIKFANTRASNFLILSFLFSGFTTLVRPTGQFLIVFLFIACVINFFAEKNRGNRFKLILSLLAGSILYLSCIVPWMIYNYKTYNFFGVAKNSGLNLYSRVVEYENTIDYDSPYIQDIKSTFEKYKVIRIANGEAEQLKSSPYYDYQLGEDAWKHHWPAYGSYVAFKKIRGHEADDVFLHAALDCIKKYPYQYVLNTLKYLGMLQVCAEPTVLYIQGISEQNKDLYPYKGMWDAGKLNNSVINAWSSNPMKGYLEDIGRFSHWTLVYAYIANPYYTLLNRADVRLIFFVLVLCGLLVSILNIFMGNRRLAWFIFVAIVSIHIVLPMLIVPGTVRMRIPLDPVLVIFYALGLFFVMCVSMRIFHVIKNCIMQIRGQKI